MKMKSFAMLAMSGLLATCFASVTPAMADDDFATSSDPSMQAPISDQSMQAPVDSNAQSTNVGGASPSDNMNNYNTNTSDNTDAASPDTATGDDDY